LSFPPLLRRLVLLLHVLTSVGFIGGAASFLALALAGLGGRPAYADMQLIAWWVALPAGYLSLLVGIVCSAGTPWGLFRYWWVIAKLGLTVIVVVVLQLQLRTIDALAAAEASGALATMTAGKTAMVLHASGGIVVLIVLTLLSIIKPRGVARFAPRAA